MYKQEILNNNVYFISNNDKRKQISQSASALVPTGTRLGTSNHADIES